MSGTCTTVHQRNEFDSMCQIFYYIKARQYKVGYKNKNINKIMIRNEICLLIFFIYILKL